jgi:excisionase family DNA binding protein
MKSKNVLSYSIKDACVATGIGRTKLYQLINNGTLHTVLVGRKRLVNADSLRALVEGSDHVAV